jgi:hypothetical protein
MVIGIDIRDKILSLPNRYKHKTMPNTYRYILLLSVLATVALFLQEWLHDAPAGPYPWQQVAMDIVFFGSFCTGVLFALGSGIYYGIRKLLKTLR